MCGFAEARDIGDTTIVGDLTVSNTLTITGDKAYYNGVEVGSGSSYDNISGSGIVTTQLVGTNLTITGTEAQTLDAVCDLGNTTDQDLTVSGSGDKWITIYSSTHEIVGLKLMRAGNEFIDYMIKVDSGYLQLFYSLNDGASWTIIWQFEDGTFDLFTYTDVDISNVLTVNASTGQAFYKGVEIAKVSTAGAWSNTGDNYTAGNLSISQAISTQGTMYSVGGYKTTGSGHSTIESNTATIVMNDAVNVQGDLSTTQSVTVGGSIYTSGYVRNDVDILDLPLDFDVSYSNGLSSSGVFLVGTFVPFDMYMESAQIITDLTLGNALTVTLYEGETQVLNSIGITSNNKKGVVNTVNNLFESGSFLGIKMNALDSAKDLTNTGVIRCRYERRSEV